MTLYTLTLGIFRCLELPLYLIILYGFSRQPIKLRRMAIGRNYLASLPDAQKAAFKVPANARMCLDNQAHYALPMACNHFKILESLAMILYRVVRSLERFTNYKTLFKTNPAIQKAIGALYSDAIDFCTRVVQFHSRSSLRAMCQFFR